MSQILYDTFRGCYAAKADKYTKICRRPPQASNSSTRWEILRAVHELEMTYGKEADKLGTVPERYSIAVGLGLVKSNHQFGAL